MMMMMMAVLIREMVMGKTSVDGLSLQRLTVGWSSRACTGDHRQHSSAHRQRESLSTFILFNFAGVQHLHNSNLLLALFCCDILPIYFPCN